MGYAINLISLKFSHITIFNHNLQSEVVMNVKSVKADKRMKKFVLKLFYLAVSTTLCFMISCSLDLTNNPESTPTGRGTAIVTLTFDDGWADAWNNGGPILASAGMHGTFYLNSGIIGTGDYMTWDQVAALAAGGHEIAGHGLTHASLKSLKGNALAREINNDRINLMNRGFQVTSFAYPFGSYNNTTKAAVAAAGYNSGRAVSNGPDKIPPLDPYALRAYTSISRRTTLADMQGYVTSCEAAGGGWVILFMHHVSNTSNDNLTILPATLQAFVNWLKARGTMVKTVHEVVGGTVKPPPVWIP